MQEKQWMLQTNVYEVNTRQYTPEGTINAFARHLPRLKEMGVEVLWFMPLTPIAEKKKKGTMGSYYACTDYTDIDTEFGTVADFKNLVSKAHEMGFKVIIDWVANHTGWDHRWTKEHPDFYKKDAHGEFLPASGMDDIIELEYANPALRLAMINAMKFWIIETGIDGFRCDLASWVELDFWVAAKKELELIRPLFWLGEFDALDHPDYMQVFDAAYTWTWMHKTREFHDTRPSFEFLLHVIQRYRDAPGIPAWFTTNHDENSWNGTEYEKYGAAAMMLAVFSCTFPGIPIIYSGQELPNLKRLKFFDKDLIEWTGENKLHPFYKTLLELRRTNPAMAAKGAGFSILPTSRSKEIFAFRLDKDNTNEVAVFLNFTAGEIAVNFSASQLQGNFREIFSGDKKDFDAEKILHLHPWGYQVWLRLE